MSFKERVYKIVSQIPTGKVATYQLVAKLAGSPGAARVVGTLMKKNPNPVFKNLEFVLPCHRVILSSGRLGEYSGGAKLKQKLLAEEGVKIKDGKVEKGYFWKKNLSLA